MYNITYKLIFLLLIIIQYYRFISFQNYSKKILYPSSCSFNGFSIYNNSKDNILLLGNSVVVGYGTMCINSLAYKLAKFTRMNIRIIGKSGINIEGLYNMIKNKNLKKYNYIIVLIGANDIMSTTPLTIIKNNFIKLILLLKKTNAKIFITHGGKLWTKSIFVFPINLYIYYRTNAVRKIYQDLSYKYNFIYIDLYTIYHKCLYNKCTLKDGLHLNNYGNNIWAMHIYNYLHKYLTM